MAKKSGKQYSDLSDNGKKTAFFVGDAEEAAAELSIAMLAKSINFVGADGEEAAGPELEGYTFALEQFSDAISQGNTRRLERLLYAQAEILNTLFTRSVSKLNHAQTLEGLRAHSEIAFKAQNQCRRTVAALTELKHPKKKPTFIKQQNNAVNQQVNNSENISDSQNEKMEQGDGERLDTGETQAAIGVDTTVETLDIHSGANIPGREETVLAEQLKNG